MDFITIISGIVLFLFLITIHEGGHFFGAKLSGIKVNEFSIGMGPLIASKKGKETQYSFRLLPIGGYVMMEGEEKDSDDKRAYNNSKPWKRFLTIFAGPAVNIIFAFLIILGISLYSGHSTNEVSSLKDNYPAKISGIEIGDEIISVNGIKTSLFQQVVQEINKSNDTVSIDIKRNNEIKTFNIVPTIESGRKVLGFTTREDNGLISSIKYSFNFNLQIISLIFTSLRDLITGNIGLSNLSGPVGVIKQVGESAKLGLNTFLLFSAMISINLGVFNLLPIPALDGSKLIFILIEMIIRRPINKKFEERITIIGFLALMALMLLTTIKDISSLF